MSEALIYYLEMTERPRDSRGLSPFPIRIEECCIAQPQFNRFLYQLVGEHWQWEDKLTWTDAQWKALIESDKHRTWVAYSEGAIAGYYELHQCGTDVEILYFGLAPQFIGRGLGKNLLEHAIQSAWDWEPVKRVWLHTCSKDHPGARANYLARGFRQYKVERESAAE